MLATRTSVFAKLFRRAPKTIRRPMPAARTQLGLTALEARDCPATLLNGTIYIYGTPAADTVYVSETVPASWYEAPKIQVVENGRTQLFSKNVSTTTVFFSGGTGNDLFQNSAYLKVFANGGGGADVLSGGPLDDAMYGDGQNDAIYGNDGNDTLYGGQGADEMRGGTGTDTLYGGVDNDTMRGGPGNDTLYGQEGNDTVYGDNNAGTAGGVGNDKLYGGPGIDTMAGEGGNDFIQGDADTDYLYGNDGHDTLRGDGGADYLYGGAGDDALTGGEGVDYLNGEAGHDSLIAIDGGLGDTVVAGNAWYDPTGWDTVWVDEVYGLGGLGTDNVQGADAVQDEVHRVRVFQNGADRTLDGDNIADPNATLDPFGNVIAANYQRFAGRPLFANAGPSNLDVTQQDRGDCWIMATAATVANDSPQKVRRMVADAGDGTYLVKLGANYYRVDADLPTSGAGTGPRNAGLGVQDSMWVAVVEKAYAHFRTGGANHAYSSLDNGDPADAARAFNLAGVGQRTYGVIDTTDAMGRVTSTTTVGSSAELGDEIRTRFNLVRNVTICTDGFLPGGNPLSRSHCWAVTGFDTDVEGNVTSVRLRNPWGSNLTVSVADMYAAGVWVTWGNA